MMDWPNGMSGMPARQAGSLAQDMNILCSIIARHLPEKCCRRLGQRLVRRFGNLRAVLRADPGELAEIPGCNMAVAEEIERTWRLHERLGSAILRDLPLLDDPEAALEYCRLLLSGETHEKFYVLFLDRGWRLTGCRCLQRGTVDHVTVYPREVLASALRMDACGIILAHNHPSGSTVPSRGDLAMTHQLVLTAEPLGVRICDHVVVGDRATFSFRQAGLLQPVVGSAFMEPVITIGKQPPGKMDGGVDDSERASVSRSGSGSPEKPIAEYQHVRHQAVSPVPGARRGNARRPQHTA